MIFALPLNIKRSGCNQVCGKKAIIERISGQSRFDLLIARMRRERPIAVLSELPELNFENILPLFPASLLKSANTHIARSANKKPAHQSLSDEGVWYRAVTVAAELSNY